MYVCSSCDHSLVFHKPVGGKEPCYLCPPAECLVKGCRCTLYKGFKLTYRPHEEHASWKVKWGSWGFVDFTERDEYTFVSGPQPAIERAGIRVR